MKQTKRFSSDETHADQGRNEKEHPCATRPPTSDVTSKFEASMMWDACDVWNREEASTWDIEDAKSMRQQIIAHSHGAYTEYAVYSTPGGARCSGFHSRANASRDGTQTALCRTHPTDRPTNRRFTRRTMLGGLPSRCFQILCRVPYLDMSVSQATTRMLAGFTMSFVPAWTSDATSFTGARPLSATPPISTPTPSFRSALASRPSSLTRVHFFHVLVTALPAPPPRPPADSRVSSCRRASSSA